MIWNDYYNPDMDNRTLIDSVQSYYGAADDSLRSYNNAMIEDQFRNYRGSGDEFQPDAIYADEFMSAPGRETFGSEMDYALARMEYDNWLNRNLYASGDRLPDVYDPGTPDYGSYGNYTDYIDDVALYRMGWNDVTLPEAPPQGASQEDYAKYVEEVNRYNKAKARNQGGQFSSAVGTIFGGALGPAGGAVAGGIAGALTGSRQNSDAVKTNALAGIKSGLTSGYLKNLFGGGEGIGGSGVEAAPEAANSGFTLTDGMDMGSFGGDYGMSLGDAGVVNNGFTLTNGMDLGAFGGGYGSSLADAGITSDIGLDYRGTATNLDRIKGAKRVYDSFQDSKGQAPQINAMTGQPMINAMASGNSWSPISPVEIPDYLKRYIGA